MRTIADTTGVAATDTGRMSGLGLELHGLTRSFGERCAVDDLSFSVAPGQLFGFVGRNGAGKTTTMRIICGLLEPDAGHVCWRGTRLDHAERQWLGYMPEERGLYPKMRVADQLEYFAVLHGATREQARAAVRRWLARLGLADRGAERVEALSHGNQQRIQLAAALVHEPALLILDEPFAGLDPIATDVMADVLREQARHGVPVLFSSHQLDLVEQLCEWVAIVDRGRLVACGEVGALRARGPRLLRLDVEDATAGWTAGLTGVEMVEQAGSRNVFKLDADADAQRILDAVRAAGTVTHFDELRPSLAELFREVVAG